LTTKIHAICDALGNPVKLALTPGQDADISQAEPMLENIDPNAFLADRAYDADRLIGRLTERGMTVVIPPKRNRTTQRETDFALYRERNLIERFFNKLKQFRAIATRYDKLKSTFLAAVQFASVIILLN
jgi:transposase